MGWMPGKFRKGVADSFPNTMPDSFPPVLDNNGSLLHRIAALCIRYLLNILLLARSRMFLPPGSFHGVPVECIERASSTYGVPYQDIVALMRNEGGRPGTAARDSNGTTDLGPMQVNTCHLPFLEKYGYRYRTLRYNGCANVMAGAWVFARCLAQTGSLLAAAACYNAGHGNMQAAWRSGYVQRFAGHLGIVIGGASENPARLANPWMDASLVVEH